MKPTRRTLTYNIKLDELNTAFGIEGDIITEVKYRGGNAIELTTKNSIERDDEE